MSRLIDDITFPVYGFPHLENIISKAEVMLIQNVADYHFAEHKDLYEWKDMPNVAPPFPVMWFEYQQPNVMYVSKKDPLYPDKRGSVIEAPPEVRGSKIGVLVQSNLIEDTQEHERWIKSMISHSPIYSNIMGRCTPPYWAMCLHIFSCALNAPMYYGGTVLLGIAKTGEVITDGSICEIPHYVLASEIYVDMMNSAIRPVSLAISFLHCKNVTMVTTDPPVKVQQRRVKEGKLPLIRYHTLEIEPMCKILRTEGQSEKTGLKLALHICRGHFKDYSKGKGLFGRFHDLYWWDSMVRGSPEHGMVGKDYNINAPDDVAKMKQ